MNVNIKPRVLIFSLAYFPFVGGAEIAVKEITSGLDNFDFDLITLRFKKSHLTEERIGSINIYRLDSSKLFFPFKAFFKARKLNRRFDYKISWAIMASYAGFGALFFKWTNPKVPLLLTLQEGDSEEHILRRVGVLYPIWKKIFRRADYIQAISNYLADFAKRYGAKCPIEVVPNGVDLKKFSIFNFQFSKNPDIKTIITTSRLVYKNGIDILIRAFSKLPNDLITQLFIVGDGPDRFKLEKLVVDLNVADRVKFVGHIDPALVPGYLSQADIFVRPSRSEGLGNSFLEAMAAGLPTVGTLVGGIGDFLKNGETGLVCKVDDPDDLAEKISLVLSDTDLASRLSENGKKLVAEKYSWENVVEKISRIMEKVGQRKLLLATGIYPPEIGGPATYATLLEKELPKKGIKITVLPFRVVRNWPKGLRHFFYFIKSLRLCRRHDLVLAQDTISVGLPSLLAAKLCRKKFLIRVPGDYVWEQSVQRFGVNDSIDDFQKRRYGFKVEFLRSIQKFVVERADVVITPSNYFRDLVRGWVKNKDKVITIYNGIDFSINYKIQVPRSKVIISVGRLMPWKGFDMVIEMMGDLPDWKLIIVGDGPEYNDLKSQISNLKLESRITLTGAIPREKVLEYLSQARVFVLNTSFESFSFQIVEAMSLGLPIVATDIGNISEIITDGVNGILASPNDKKEFLVAVKKIDEDGDFRNKLSKNAILRSKDFSIEKTVSALAEIIKQ